MDSHWTNLRKYYFVNVHPKKTLTELWHPMLQFPEMNVFINLLHNIQCVALAKIDKDGRHSLLRDNDISGFADT